MTKTDRRVQRTRELLQKALIELIREHGYDAITIQDLMDRANVGRTTFYLHYWSKGELFISCHEAIASETPLGATLPTLPRSTAVACSVPGEDLCIPASVRGSPTLGPHFSMVRIVC